MNKRDDIEKKKNVVKVKMSDAELEYLKKLQEETGYTKSYLLRYAIFRLRFERLSSYEF